MAFPRERILAAGLATLVATSAWPVQAYLDPGTGSMIISAIVGLFATLALAVKTYWYKLVGLFRKKPGSDAVTPSSDNMETGAQQTGPARSQGEDQNK